MGSVAGKGQLGGCDQRTARLSVLGVMRGAGKARAGRDCKFVLVWGLYGICQVQSLALTCSFVYREGVSHCDRCQAWLLLSAAGTPAMAMSLEPGELLRGGSGCPLTDRVPSGGPNPLYCNVHRVPKVRGSTQPSRAPGTGPWVASPVCFTASCKAAL